VRRFDRWPFYVNQQKLYAKYVHLVRGRTDLMRRQHENLAHLAAQMDGSAAHALATTPFVAAPVGAHAPVTVLPKPAAPAPVPVVSTTPAASFTTIAFADDLVADPGLLTGYVRQFTRADTATLAIYAPDWDEAQVGIELSRIVASSGIAAEELPDLVVLVVPRNADTEARLASGASAVLATSALREPFAKLPRFDAGQLPSLKSAADSALGRVAV
jgi:hypothetical protein